MSMFRFRAKVTLMRQLPAPLTDRSSWMPSVVLTASSIGYATCDSCSAGEAPGNRTKIRTVGSSTDGKRFALKFP